MTHPESNDSRLSAVVSDRTVPVDMIGVCLVLAGITAVYYGVSTASIRFLAAVPLVVFLPGYVVVGLLFPQAGTPSEDRATAAGSLSTVRNLGRVTVAERLALAFGLSIAIVPFFGFLLELLPVAAFDGAILPTLVGFVFVGAVAATVRRLRTPANERFTVPLAALGTAIAAPFTGPMARSERIATLVLAAAVLVAVVSVGFVLAAPQSGEAYTDLRVMTESPDGELTLGAYPDEVSTNDPLEIVVGIDNRETAPQEYTVVITADQLIADEGGITPIESTEVARFESTLEDGERRHQPHTVDFGTTGEFRLNYYLYIDEPPADPGAESAYRHVHFTTSVVGGGDSIDGSADIEGTVDTNRATTHTIPTQSRAEAGTDQ